MPRKTVRLGSRRRPEESRAAILRAAVNEFARGGIAGARTDAIANAAKVNKALLYYYFKDKQALYGAVLDEVFERRNAAIMKALDSDLPPRERLLAYVGAHFDYISKHPIHTAIVHAEMMGLASRGSVHLKRTIDLYFRPLFGRLVELLKEGMAAREFRAVDPMEFVPTMTGTIVFYFISAPLVRLMGGPDPFSRERIAKRRAAVLDFISAALFVRPTPAQGETK